MRLIDSAIALRILYLLVTPIENTNAYKLGLIDRDGKTVRKAATPEEKNSTSMLHRLVWNLKRLISLVPGGSTRLGSLAAAYLLVRESMENEWTNQQLTEQVLLNFNTLCNDDINEELDSFLDQLYQLYEDAPANASGAPVSTDVPTARAALLKRKQTKSIEVAE